MAKMFYTLEETAQKLGISVDKVREMSTSGKIQQFRDRDKLMFKREQIDAMSRSASDDSGGPLPLASSGDTDAIDLTEEPRQGNRKEDPRQATGVSVFDADEVEPADPRAQTQVTQSPVADQEQLALDSVGSGSGLLDLTRESDDTSLGAELLDEIYPGGGEGSDAKQGDGSPSSGVFDGAVALESGPSGLENLGHTAAMPSEIVAVQVEDEAYDPAGSGLATGALIGAMIALFVGLSIAFSALAGTPTQIVTAMSANTGALLMYTGILLAAVLVFAGVGFAIGKTREG